MLTNVTRPPGAISTCFGLTPAAVIVTVGWLAAGGGVVVGVGVGVMIEDDAPPPQPLRVTASAQASHCNRTRTPLLQR